VTDRNEVSLKIINRVLPLHIYLSKTDIWNNPVLLINVLGNAYYKKNKMPTVLMIRHLSSDCRHLQERSVACKPS